MRAFALMSISMLVACLALVQAPAHAKNTAGGSSPFIAQPIEGETGRAVTEPKPDPLKEPTGGWIYGVEAPAPGADGPVVAGTRAKLIDGVAHAPALAPPAVQAAVWAANQIVGKPYRWGGGHGKWNDSGYDCSGAVSFALHGGELLDSPLDSGSFMRWGRRGKGDWITVYTNPGHAYAVIAGLRLDTSAVNDRAGRKGPQWRPRARPSRGFRARHPEGL